MTARHSSINRPLLPFTCTFHFLSQYIGNFSGLPKGAKASSVFEGGPPPRERYDESTTVSWAFCLVLAVRRERGSKGRMACAYGMEYLLLKWKGSVLQREMILRLAGENASEERQQRVGDYLRAVANASLRRLGALRRFAGDRSLPQSDLLQLVLEVKFNFSHTAANVPPLRMTLLEEGVCYYSNARVALLASPLPEEESGVTASKYVTSVDHVDITGSLSYMNTGYRLFVSSPDEIPNMMSAGHSAMQLSQLEMFVGVLPMSATEALLSLRVEQRRCRQAHESPLGISPHYYTYGLCRLQCRIDLATKLCGCVPYFYPRQEEMVTLPEGLADCDCLPRCSERHYYPLDYKLLDNDNGGGAALYRWSVKQFPRVNLRKDVLFTFVDLLVSFGGAASFFMGCSILSLVELVYYMTLRLYFYRRAALNR
ncbi:uncharacterized protein LOC124775498 [Schistocerca piceifrons]|uniref:uncharacterized protein LOC124775498 n=1 Tax=Schistocerca piceifrons TaxID=274613 RepID=UPI001F5EBFE8|nr:uncharacterized protein LOC124775498 [Schistocerca piceifrons]